MPTQPFPDLGPTCTYRQATFSATALRKGILDNTPTADDYTRMLHVYNNAYVAVGQRFGVWPHINSFYRSPRLVSLPHGHFLSVNSAVGGAPDSNHIRGMAMDLDYDNIVGAPTNIELFDWIRENLSFYELICEVPDANNKPAWVHVATNVNDPDRKLIKRMIYLNGQKVYQHWPWVF